MANGAQGFPGHTHASQQQQQQLHPDLTRTKLQQQHMQQQALAAAANASATQLQQRAAAAAQFLTAERKITTREIQAMLEKNDAALRGWNALHTQEPPKSMAKEHKDWVRKCLVYRQQIGARLEVLASLADKQIATEDESSATKATASAPMSVPTPKPTPKPTPLPQTASKKSKASAALARQAAQNKSKAAAAAAARARTPSPATVSNSSTSNNAMLQPPTANATATSSAMALAAPIESPLSFPEPPMPSQGVASHQQFGYAPGPGSDAAAFFGAVPSGFSNASMANFPMAGSAQAFGNSGAYGNGASDPTSAFLTQQQQTNNFMMTPAAMNMAMMNPQYLAMQMQQMQQTPMGNMGMATTTNNGSNSGLYGAPAMFNSYNAMGSHQLPADPFNASFSQSAFGGGSFNPLAGGFDAMGGMMNPMTSFPMLPDPMLLNAFPYGMNMAPMPDMQQQQQPMPFGSVDTISSSTGLLTGSSSTASASTGPAANSTSVGAAPLLPTSTAPTADAFGDSGSLFDDASLFDGFPDDDAFLQM